MEKPDSTMEVNQMETTMNDILPETNAPVDEAPQPNAAARPAPRAGRLGDDVVRWAEFRLAMWMGGFALAVIISTQGFLYSALLGLKDDIGYLGAEMQKQGGELRAEMQRQNGELRAEMQRLNGELRAEMQRQNGDLRAEMQRQNGELRAEMQRLNGELHAEMQRLNGELRVDMQTQIDDLRLDMQTQFGELRVEMQTQFAEQRERTVRIETHLGIDTDAAYKGN